MRKFLTLLVAVPALAACNTLRRSVRREPRRHLPRRARRRGARLRGAGFQCDDCGKTVILRQQQSLDLPAGWFVLIGPDPGEREVFTERHEFCSIACVAEFAHRGVCARRQFRDGGCTSPLGSPCVGVFEGPKPAARLVEDW